MAGPKVASPTFLNLRSTAVMTFQSSLTQRLQNCTASGSAAPPHPRDVRFVFTWQPQQSTPELQQLIVTDVQIVDVGGISTQARDCIEHTRGMQLTLPVPPDQLPLDSREFAQMIPVAVP